MNPVNLSHTFRTFKAAVETTGISADLVAQLPTDELSRLADASLAAQLRIFNPNRNAPAEATGLLIKTIEFLREQPLSSLDHIKGLREFVVTSEDEAMTASRTSTVGLERQLEFGKRLLLQRARHMTQVSGPAYMSRISTGTFTLEDPLARTREMELLMETGPYSESHRALFNATQYIRFIRWRLEDPAEWEAYLLSPKVRKHINKERLNPDPLHAYYTANNSIFYAAMSNRTATWRNFLSGDQPFASPKLIHELLYRSGIVAAGFKSMSAELREAALVDGIWRSRAELNTFRLNLLHEFDDYLCEFDVEEAKNKDVLGTKVALIDGLTFLIAERPIVVSELFERFPPERDIAAFLAPLTDSSSDVQSVHGAWIKKFIGNPDSDPSLPKNFRFPLRHEPEVAVEALKSQRRLLAAVEFKRQELGRAVAQYVGTGEVDLASVSAGNNLPNGRHRVLGALIDDTSAAAEYAHIVDNRYRRHLGKTLSLSSIRDGSLPTYTLAIDAEHLCRALDANRAAWLLTWDRTNPELIRVCGRILGFVSGEFESKLPDRDIKLVDPSKLPRG